MKNKFLLFSISLLAVLTFLTGCNKKEFTITFDTDGGSNIAEQTIKKDEKVSKPNDPTKNGYTFLEWSYENDTYDFDTKVKKDITLVAKWNKVDESKSYNVKFDTDGGNTIADQLIKYGKKINEPNKPTKDGYTFVKWTVNGSDFDFNSTVTKDIILKATWTKNDAPVINPGNKNRYTVTFNSNGGSVVYNKTVNEGQAVQQPGNPTKAGFDFTGWTLNGAAYNFGTAVNKNITLVANWKAVVVADKYTFTVAKVDAVSPSRKINVFKNGTDVTKSVGAVYSANGLYLGKYSDEYNAIIVDESNTAAIGAIKVNGQTIKF